MPLVCRMSALTARPQRIPNLSQITYPSDSYVWLLNHDQQYYLQDIICTDFINLKYDFSFDLYLLKQ